MAMTNRERGNIFGDLMGASQMHAMGIISEEMWAERRDVLMARLMDEATIVEGVL